MSRQRLEPEDTSVRYIFRVGPRLAARADRGMRQLGLSASELFRNALEAYLDKEKVS